MLLLKARAYEFFKLAEVALRDGRYDVACSLFEQAVQLYLKYLLLKFFDVRVKGYDLRILIGTLALKSRNYELNEFVKRRRRELVILEESYYVGRYDEYEYEKEEGEICRRAFKELFELRRVERALEAGRSEDLEEVSAEDTEGFKRDL